jgi:biotin carboxyl carrier protein
LRIRLFHRGEAIEADVDPIPGGHRVRIGDRDVEVRRLAAGAVAIDGRAVRFLAERTSTAVRIAVGGELHELEIGAGAARARGGHGVASPETRSPIPGKVLKLETEVGAVVEPGDPLLILEAMKMENVLVAELAGTVKEIHVTAGEMVDPGRLLVVIEPTES